MTSGSSGGGWRRWSGARERGNARARADTLAFPLSRDWCECQSKWADSAAHACVARLQLAFQRAVRREADELVVVQEKVYLAPRCSD